MGSCEIFSTIILRLLFMELIPMAATVPINVAATAETTATISVTFNASIKAASLNISRYALSENPFHLLIVLDSVNENTIRTNIGA